MVKREVLTGLAALRCRISSVGEGCSRGPLLIRISVIGAFSITTWLLVTTAIMHARDVMGVLLLLLVATGKRSSHL